MARTKEDVVASKADASPRIAKSAGGISKDSEAPVKRGRGRPRSNNPPKVYVPSGRPRGRPKGTTKAVTAAKRAALGEAAGLEAPKTRGQANDADGARKGRGRPRKAAGADVAAPVAATPKGGKKRGRPSKKATESPAAPEGEEEEEQQQPDAAGAENAESDDDKDIPAVAENAESPVNEEALDEDLSE
ncbi:hypothetical protein FDECE_11103 [Fusarium decemcellulare]|nr:hypothetical protein FDECE_11103 [Fusarium decemcellulare]